MNLPESIYDAPRSLKVEVEDFNLLGNESATPHKPLRAAATETFQRRWRFVYLSFSRVPVGKIGVESFQIDEQRLAVVFDVSVGMQGTPQHRVHLWPSAAASPSLSLSLGFASSASGASLSRVRSTGLDGRLCRDRLVLHS